MILLLFECPLEKVAPRTACPATTCLFCPQKPPFLHSHFRAACANCGNWVPLHALIRPNFQMCFFPAPRFRNPSRSLTAATQWSSPRFPHFLPQLRVLLLYISSFLSQTESHRRMKYRSSPAGPILGALAGRTHGGNRPDFYQFGQFFHEHGNSTVNTIKEKKRQLLFYRGVRGSCPPGRNVAAPGN